MATEIDLLQNLYNRLERLKAQKAQEINEIEDQMRALRAIPDTLGKTPAASVQPKAKPEPGARHNTGMADKIREYITSHTGKMDVPELVDWLLAHGFTGKRRSVDASVRMEFARAAKRGLLQYRKGEGYFKPEEERTRLVYEGETGAVDKSVIENGQ